MDGGDLLSVAGASAAAAVVAQFGKLLFGLDVRWTRTICLVVGLIVVLGSVILDAGPASYSEIVLSMVVGMQAGMAAWAGFDIVRDGLSYEVSPALPPDALDPRA